ncbi:MAG: transposase [Kiritimatiellae bacterium]|nr:transposase [Kiritimatiellia bacterium]
MARMNRLKKDGDAHYHVTSRTNGRAFLLKDPALKREIVDLLKRSAAFSGVELKAYCVMDDHFHFVCRVEKPDEPVNEREILKRIAILKGERFAGNLSMHWAQIRKSGLECQVEEELCRWRGRMHDISEMAKTFKELVNVAYKRRKPHCGGLWSGRFKSTLVEDGRYLATCVRYVELNPVRAGMVNRARDYAFSSQNSESAALYVAFKGVEGGSEGIEGRLMGRIAQIAGGVVFGGHAFVAGWAAAEGWRAKPQKVLPDAYSSHGHVLAKAA